jgi:hypothetical protein
MDKLLLPYYIKDAILMISITSKSLNEKKMKFRNPSMSDSGSHLKFDFNQAVADARRDYLDETENTTFVDLSAPDAKAQVEEWFKEYLRLSGISEERLEKSENVKEIIRQEAEKIFRNPLGKSWTITAGGKTISLLALATELPRTGIMLSLPFIFRHELGHIVAKNGHPSDANKFEALEEQQMFHEKNQHERVADCFAVLYGLQQGDLSKADIVQLILERQVEIGTDHDTIEALITLLNGFESIGVASLTPEKVKKEASRYGTPTV